MGSFEIKLLFKLTKTDLIQFSFQFLNPIYWGNQPNTIWFDFLVSVRLSSSLDIKVEIENPKC